MFLLLMLLTTAQATQDCGEPVSAAQFREWVAEADDKLSDDDVVGHGTIYKTIQANVDCLTEPVPSEAWAEFLVGLAVIEHALGQPWREPMTSALLTDPLVVRDYGPEEVQQFTVELPVEGEIELTDGTYYVDGREVEHPRPLPGVHILQRKVRGDWYGLVVRSGEWPEDWLPTKVVKPSPTKPPEPAAPAPQPTAPAPAEPAPQGDKIPGGSWATVSLFGGYAIDGREVDEGSSLGDDPYGGPTIGVVSSGEIVFEKAGELLETLFNTDVDTGGAEPGFFWEASSDLRLGSASALTPEAYGGLRLGFGPVAAWLGGGVSSVQVLESSDDEANTFFFAQPRIGFRTALPLGGWSLDAGGGGGWTPQGFHGNGTLGMRSTAGTGLAFGLDGHYAQVEHDGDAGEQSATKIRVGLRVGAALGGSRRR